MLIARSTSGCRSFIASTGNLCRYIYCFQSHSHAIVTRLTHSHGGVNLGERGIVRWEDRMMRVCVNWRIEGKENAKMKGYRERELEKVRIWGWQKRKEKTTWCLNLLYLWSSVSCTLTDQHEGPIASSPIEETWAGILNFVSEFFLHHCPWILSFFTSRGWEGEKYKKWRNEKKETWKWRFENGRKWDDGRMVNWVDGRECKKKLLNDLVIYIYKWFTFFDRSATCRCCCIAANTGN